MKSAHAILLASACLLSREARGATSDAPSANVTSPHPRAATEPAQEPSFSIVPKQATGFLSLTVAGQRALANAPSQQATYALSGLSGLGVMGAPYEHWDYTAYLLVSVSSSTIRPLDGSIFPEQITLRYTPFKSLSLQAGYMRIPFSFAQSMVIFRSMFPTRPEPTALFHAGADAGFLAGYEHPSNRVRIKAGAFDGMSLGLTMPNHVSRAPVFSAWAEVSPLGAMKHVEADFDHSPLRFAVAGGVLYRSATAYDRAGYQGLVVDDQRFSSTVRLALRGFFAQAEYLVAVQSDNRSGRARVARGAYAEASYYTAITRRVGFAPLTRLGWSRQDEGFFPLHTVSFHAGLAIFPAARLEDPSVARVVVEYQSERRVEERVTAQGASMNVMLRF